MRTGSPELCSLAWLGLLGHFVLSPMFVLSPAPVFMGSCLALWGNAPESMATLVPGACGAFVPAPVAGWVPAPEPANVCFPHLCLVDRAAMGPFKTWNTASAQIALVRETGRS